MADLENELIEKAARAAAIFEGYDGCFEVVDEWEALSDDEKRASAEDEPIGPREDCDWWRARMRAGLEALVPAIRAQALEDAAAAYPVILRDMVPRPSVARWMRARAVEERA